jgi:hypothetical protein
MPLDWLADMHDRVRVQQASTRAEQASAQSSETRGDVHRLQAEVDRLSLICRAMWSLMQDTSGLTEEDLMRRVEEVDLLDGKRDGRMRPAVRSCAQCGRNNKPQRSACMYCETPLPVESAFG